MSEGTRAVDPAAEITALRGKVQELEKQIDFLLATANTGAENIQRIAAAMRQMIERLRTVEAQGKVHTARLDAVELIQRAGRHAPALTGDTGTVVPDVQAQYKPLA